MEEIIFESETSKGSFYHYFDGKDALLSSLSVLFDERYEELMQQPHDEMDCIELLCWLNQELFTTIENTVSIELLARLFSSQLVTKGEKHLLDRKRMYYRLLRQIVSQGQEREELTDTRTVSEIVKAYAMFERLSCDFLLQLSLRRAQYRTKESRRKYRTPYRIIPVRHCKILNFRLILLHFLQDDLVDCF